MNVATLDTHAVVKDLRSAGFTDEQAEALARNIRKAQELDLGNLATKADIEAVKADIAEAKAEILKWMFGTIGFQTLIILGTVVALIKVVKP